jgi:hypothetical protein
MRWKPAVMMTPGSRFRTNDRIRCNRSTLIRDAGRVTLDIDFRQRDCPDHRERKRRSPESCGVFTIAFDRPDPPRSSNETLRAPL